MNPTRNETDILFQLVFDTEEAKIITSFNINVVSELTVCYQGYA